MSLVSSFDINRVNNNYCVDRLVYLKKINHLVQDIKKHPFEERVTDIAGKMLSSNEIYQLINEGKEKHFLAYQVDLTQVETIVDKFQLIKEHPELKDWLETLQAEIMTEAYDERRRKLDQHSKIAKVGSKEVSNLFIETVPEARLPVPVKSMENEMSKNLRSAVSGVTKFLVVTMGSYYLFTNREPIFSTFSWAASNLPHTIGAPWKAGMDPSFVNSPHLINEKFYTFTEYSKSPPIGKREGPLSMFETSMNTLSSWTNSFYQAFGSSPSKNDEVVKPVSAPKKKFVVKVQVKKDPVKGKNDKNGKKPIEFFNQTQSGLKPENKPIWDHAENIKHLNIDVSGYQKDENTFVNDFVKYLDPEQYINTNSGLDAIKDWLRAVWQNSSKEELAFFILTLALVTAKGIEGVGKSDSAQNKFVRNILFASYIAGGILGVSQTMLNTEKFGDKTKVDFSYASMLQGVVSVASVHVFKYLQDKGCSNLDLGWAYGATPTFALANGAYMYNRFLESDSPAGVAAGAYAGLFIPQLATVSKNVAEYYLKK